MYWLLWTTPQAQDIQCEIVRMTANWNGLSIALFLMAVIHRRRPKIFYNTYTQTNNYTYIHRRIHMVRTKRCGGFPKLKRIAYKKYWSKLIRFQSFYCLLGNMSLTGVVYLMIDTYNYFIMCKWSYLLINCSELFFLSIKL